jgi:DNA-directed RNA polymerase sigma subunit (sigma70/sigma32)
MDEKEKEQYEEDSDSDDIDPWLIELMEKEMAKREAKRAASPESEMVTLRIGGKLQQLTKQELEQFKQVMKTLEPLEREVLRLKFGLPDEYFEECD